MLVPKLALSLAALVLLGVGAAGLISPLAIVGSAGIEAPEGLALSEARLIFGLFHVLIGGFFAAPALGLGRTPLDSALRMQAILFGGMGTGRLLVIFLDDAWSGFHAGGLAMDFTLLALALWALWSLGRRPATA